MSWSSGLFDCHQDYKTCCYGCFCMPCLLCENMSRLQAGPIIKPSAGDLHETCCIVLCFYAMLPCCCFWCIDLPSRNRTLLRTKYNLPEEPCTDGCVYCFCIPCSICQESRELNHRGYIASPCITHCFSEWFKATCPCSGWHISSSTTSIT